MKVRNFIIATSALFSAVTLSFAADTLNNIQVASKGVANSKLDTSIDFNYFIQPFADTWNSLTNKNNTWGLQDRNGQWYLGLGISGFANHVNSKGSNSGWNGIAGYNISKYIAFQYNQFITYNGMAGGLGEGVLNLSNSTMFTPYAVGGAGWANLAGRAAGAWDVGGGIKCDFSRNLQAAIDYRYIQTIGPKPGRGSSHQLKAKADTNMIGVGFTWFFGGDIASISTVNVQNKHKKDISLAVVSIPTIDENKYLLPKGIRQCKGNFNLTKDGVACYTVNGDKVTVYLDTKFAYDSTKLNKKGKEAIASFINFIKDSKIASVIIKGYASQGQTGDEFEIYNQKLSEKRAQVVAEYMEKLGIESSKIVTKGFGYYDTLSGLDKSDATNQRVQANVSAPLKEIH